MVEGLLSAVNRFTEENKDSFPFLASFSFSFSFSYLVMVSAHLTESVLKDPKTSIIPARPKWIGFQPILTSPLDYI